MLLWTKYCVNSIILRRQRKHFVFFGKYQGHLLPDDAKKRWIIYELARIYPCFLGNLAFCSTWKTFRLVYSTASCRTNQERNWKVCNFNLLKMFVFLICVLVIVITPVLYYSSREITALKYARLLSFRLSRFYSQIYHALTLGNCFEEKRTFL
jgi:hypothetical protein